MDCCTTLTGSSIPFYAHGHNRADEPPLNGVRNTLRNGSVGIRGESGLNDRRPCGSGKKYKRRCGGARVG